MAEMETAKAAGKGFLVTGGAGFIGSAMCEQLLAAGGRVICIDNFSTGTRENIAALEANERFTLIAGDVNEYDTLAKVFSVHAIDYVLHYAAVVGVVRTLENPLAVLRDIDGIKNVLALSKEHGVAKVFFASSSEVYGENMDMPSTEDRTPINARLPYAIVKAVGEQYCRAYTETYGLKTVSLRFFNVYGPRQEGSGYGFVTAIFVRQVLDGESPTVFGDGSQTRDFVYIKDNVAATVRALFDPKVSGTEINIGTGKEVSVLELAKTIIRAAGKKLEPVFLPPREKGDMPRRCPDVSRMKELLGFSPQYSLEEGIREAIASYGE
jgi:UDP-glucose 4-epimerase